MMNIATVPEWWKECYDDLRQRTGFGNLPEERTRGDIDAVEHFLDLHPPANVLDLFCGTGRHCLELAKRGYDVTGLDYSQEYVAFAQERARKEGISFRLLQGDARAIEWGRGYAAILVMWASFGFFDDEEDRLIVQKMSHALNRGGKVYLEVKHRDWEVRHFEPSRQFQIEDIYVEAVNIFDLFRSRLETTFTYRRGEQEWTRFQSWRVYSAHEFRALLESEGLMVVGIYGDSRGGILTLESHLMRVIAEKL
jgi:SAM-dependent methyltransferase